MLREIRFFEYSTSGHIFKRLVSNIPGVKRGSVLEQSVVMHEQEVPVLGLPVTEEGSEHHLHLHLGLRQLPPADSRQQQRGAEPAEQDLQHHVPGVHVPGVRVQEETDRSSTEEVEQQKQMILGTWQGRVVAGSSPLIGCFSSETPPTDSPSLTRGCQTHCCPTVAERAPHV